MQSRGHRRRLFLLRNSLEIIELIDSSVRLRIYLPEQILRLGRATTSLTRFLAMQLVTSATQSRWEDKCEGTALFISFPASFRSPLASPASADCTHSRRALIYSMTASAGCTTRAAIIGSNRTLVENERATLAGAVLLLPAVRSKSREPKNAASLPKSSPCGRAYRSRPPINRLSARNARADMTSMMYGKSGALCCTRIAIIRPLALVLIESRPDWDSSSVKNAIAIFCRFARGIERSADFPSGEAISRVIAREMRGAAVLNKRSLREREFHFSVSSTCSRDLFLCNYCKWTHFR